MVWAKTEAPKRARVKQTRIDEDFIDNLYIIFYRGDKRIQKFVYIFRGERKDEKTL
jgi:hypothetical protein